MLKVNFMCPSVATIILFVILYQTNAQDTFRKRENIRTPGEINPSTQINDPQISQQSKKLWNTTTDPIEELLRIYSGSCEPIDYYTPDFRAEGRRISEVKCLEYIWQIRHSVQEMKRNETCRKIPSIVPIIVGGNNAKIGEFPHMGAIGWKGAESGAWLFKCGGVLISEKFMLSAAHCSRISWGDTSVSDPFPKIVRFGATKIIAVNMYGVHSKDVEISRFIVHDQYQSPKRYYDIALIELQQKLEFTRRIHPACIWTSNTEITGKASLAGWGVVDTASHRTSAVLQVATVDMLPSQECNNTLKVKRNRNWNRGLAPHQICAGHLAGGIDSCQGDSGGPLQVKIDMPIEPLLEWRAYYVVGITSFGYGCALQNTPSVYSRVSYFIDWIENIVWNTDLY